MAAPPPARAAGPRPGDALGLVETFGLVAAIEAADAMLKAADVRLVRQQRTIPGLVTHAVAGETAAVRAAVDAARAAAERVGRVVAVHVIPRPDEAVWRTLLGVTPENSPSREPSERPAPTPGRDAPPAPAPDGYAAMTVRDLRALARDRADVALRGRAVAAASREDLLAALADADAAAR